MVVLLEWVPLTYFQASFVMAYYYPSLIDCLMNVRYLVHALTVPCPYFQRRFWHEKITLYVKLVENMV